MTFKAGASKTDITPPAGTIMAAFPAKRAPEMIARKATGAHDPLYTRAIALNSEDTTVIVCSTDLCALRRITIKNIREDICCRIPQLKPENILLSVTHTHSGPETSFLFGGNPEMDFVKIIEKQIADNAVKAYQDLSQVKISWAKSELDMNHNRRVFDENGKQILHMEYDAEKTTGPTDNELYIVKFIDESDSSKALLYHYTAHSLTLGAANNKFSADYPGFANNLIEAAMPGCTALFVNGAAGNIHPRQCMREEPEARDTIGKILGHAVLNAIQNTEAISSPSLKNASDTLIFKNRHDSSLEVKVEADILKIGPLVFGYVPGEFFVEHQLTFKNGIAPAPGTLVGYSNGWPGYVPNKAAYKEGGYGVELSTDQVFEYSRTSLPEGAGEKMIERLIEMADCLKSEEEEN
ncbi:MAG: neutral/alkaline non-lysosomal ceramidase N-terminal domain-containing protein [Planctomycetota bacterium]|jgi:hypothetical protein